jgi:hypothetical protein
MWLGTKDSKENIGPISQSTSVGEILYSLAVAYPAATPFPFGASLMQATFISAGGGGFALLFDERNVNGECQYDNAFNGAHLLLYRRGLDVRYGPGTADALEERYRDSHFKGKTTKGWSKKVYEAKIIEIKGKLAAL